MPASLSLSLPLTAFTFVSSHSVFYQHTHRHTPDYSLLISSDLMVVLPLTLPLRLYNPRPLRLMKEPGLLQGRETVDPRVRPGTNSSNPLQPNSCTSRVPANKRQLSTQGKGSTSPLLEHSKQITPGPLDLHETASRSMRIRSSGRKSSVNTTPKL